MALQKTIYKLAKSKKIQIWQVELDEAQGRYRTISGLESGKKVTSEWTVCEGKNIGRANATTAKTQAIAEVEAMYTKKLDQGRYFEDKAVAQSGATTFEEPMLAKVYADYIPTDSDFSSGKVWCQPKLDGVRCIANADGLWSREGNAIVSCQHVIDALAPYFKKDPSLILDGELYADKFKDNFNKIISLIRREKTTPEERMQCENNIVYHIYDLICIKDKKDIKFSGRTSKLKTLIPTRYQLKLVDTYNPLSLKELDKLYGDFVADGYEGQMVRLNEAYEVGRSASLLKRKEFVDNEFTILDILEGEGNRSGMAGKIVYQLDDNLPHNYPDKEDNTFSSGIAGGVAFYTKLLKEKKKYIGGEGTVRHFHYTPKGIPRFPVTKAVYKGKRDL